VPFSHRARFVGLVPASRARTAGAPGGCGKSRNAVIVFACAFGEKLELVTGPVNARSGQAHLDIESQFVVTCAAAFFVRPTHSTGARQCNSAFSNIALFIRVEAIYVMLVPHLAFSRASDASLHRGDIQKSKKYTYIVVYYFISTINT